MRSMAAIGSTNSPFHSGDRLRVDELFVRHGSAANGTSLADAFDMQLATAIAASPPVLFALYFGFPVTRPMPIATPAHAKVALAVLRSIC